MKDDGLWLETLSIFFLLWHFYVVACGLDGCNGHLLGTMAM